jgi:cysteine desulfurase
MRESVYLDYAATTPVDERVVEAMVPYLSETFGNPNSLYGLGRESFQALEDARGRIAACLGAEDPREIVFTGCGTEADNSAVIGIALATEKRNHVVVSAFEHHAVLEPAEHLRRSGFEVSLVSPDSEGIVQPDALERYVREDTALVSVMHANNELGTVQPIGELARVAHEVGASFHSDAVQSVGKIPLDVEETGVDALAISAHKIYGPKGVGALYLRRGTPFQPLLRGGGQESGRRSGTQNVAGAVALAMALELMIAEREEESRRLADLRDELVAGVLEGVENTELNGSTTERLPHIANFLIKGVEGESMLLHLDNEGFAVSTGSACSSSSLEPSHVLLAIGCPKELAHGSLRVSLGRFTKPEDVAGFLEILPGIVGKLRGMSPVYEKTFGQG